MPNEKQNFQLQRNVRVGEGIKPKCIKIQFYRADQEVDLGYYREPELKACEKR